MVQGDFLVQTRPRIFYRILNLYCLCSGFRIHFDRNKNGAFSREHQTRKNDNIFFSPCPFMRYGSLSILGHHPFWVVVEIESGKHCW
jgi:hypothetical protein